MKTKLLTCFFVLCISAGLFSQSKDPNEILNNVKAAFEEIHDYKVDVHLKIDVEFLKVPESDATLFYKQPDKVHIESEKFALMPRQGLEFSPEGLMSDKYTALYEQEDTLGNIPVSVVKTIPLGNDDDVILITFWIDQSNNRIIRVETSRKPSGTYSMDFKYEDVGGENILPASIEFSFTVDPSMFRRHRGFDAEVQTQEDISKKKEKTGRVYLTFSNYEINKGLPDDIFDETNGETATDK